MKKVLNNRPVLSYFLGQPSRSPFSVPVDGRNPAPVDRWNEISLFIGFQLFSSIRFWISQRPTVGMPERLLSSFGSLEDAKRGEIGGASRAPGAVRPAPLGWSFPMGNELGK